MKTIKNKLKKTLYAVILLASAIFLGSFSPVYANENTTEDLINVGLQAPIDGVILLPYYEFPQLDGTTPNGLHAHEHQGNAVFIYRCHQYTEGTIPSPSTITDSDIARLQGIADMTKAGYIFVGWQNGNHIFQPLQAFILPEGAGHFYFYAVWAPVVLLSLHANNGTNATQTVRRATGAPMLRLPPQPTKPGYNFLGWFTTPEETGGSRLNSFASAPTADTTYWARWGAPINVTVYYENLVNVDTADALVFVDASISGIKGLFLDNFDIDLVLRPGTTRYEPALNQVGTSATDILNINPSNDTTIIFRFVDFPLNEGRIAGLARPIRGFEGTPQMHLGDMVVTTQLTLEMFTRAIVHEIAHLFGAYDCSNRGCVMDISRLHTIHDHWCASCRSDIHNYLSIRVHNNPHLGN